MAWCAFGHQRTRSGMLQTLEIRGYRGFESYRLTNLARVNLVVGKNNCGKTAVLEAIELLVSGGHPSVFLASLARRSGAGLREVSSDISPIFIGHKCVPGASFELSSDDAGNTLSVRILSLEEIGDEAEDWCLDGTQRQQRNLGHPDEAVMPMFGMSISQATPGTHRTGRSCCRSWRTAAFQSSVCIAGCATGHPDRRCTSIRLNP